MESVMQGKVVLVTGGAKRVGAAICRRLHAAGAQLAVHYRSSESEALALRDELNALRPDSAAIFQTDLLDLNALPQLAHQVIKKFGKLDALVNNASSFYATPLADISNAAICSAPICKRRCFWRRRRQPNCAVSRVVS
jgi:pteridine reductase